MRQGLESDIRAAFDAAVACDWRSYDPFDLLRSPYLSWLRGRRPLAARVAVQLGRRSGGAVRRTLRVSPHEEAKAIADFLRAASILSAAGVPWARGFVDPLRAKLLALRSGGGWGLGFPYASRFVNFDADIPNAYTTLCAIEALLDSAEGEHASTTSAVDACRFIVEELGSFELGGRRWQRYWPGLDDPIVNVQAMAGSAFARAAAALEEPAFSEYADERIETVVGAQRPDGSWPYSAEPRGAFVDGFHTGFVLQALAEYAARRPEQAETVHDALARGMGFFRERLMTDDALPLGFADGKVSLDAQNVSQCVQTLVVAARGDDDLDTALRVWDEAGRRRRSPLRVGGGYVSLRWSLGPGVLAAAWLATNERFQSSSEKSRKI